jgi:hypothetical protein
MLTPFGAGENSAVPTLLPIPSRSSALAVFCAAAENAVEITSAAVNAIVLCIRIGCEVYPNPIKFFVLKFSPADSSGKGFSLWVLVARTSRLGATKTNRLKPAPLFSYTHSK